VESITVRLGFKEIKDRLECEPSGGIKTADNAAFGGQPQGYEVTNRLAEGARRPRPPQNAFSVAVS
jgi:hypothetical protein